MNPIENHLPPPLASLLKEIQNRQRLGPGWKHNKSAPGLNPALQHLSTAKLARGFKTLYGRNDIRNLSDINTLNSHIEENAKRVCCIVLQKQLKENRDGTYTLKTKKLSRLRLEDSRGYRRELCPSENFLNESYASFGSGFLIKPNKIATAAHNLLTDDGKYDLRNDMKDFRFLFTFEGNKTRFRHEEVYSFGNYQDFQDYSFNSHPPNRKADWAVIELDRPVSRELTPLRLRRTQSVPNGNELYVIGHPLGLPKKIATHANVRGNGASDYFTANLDTLAGNSGSPVFNASDHTVEGILVRGEKDFILSDAGCMISFVVPDSGGRGEDCQRITALKKFL